MGQVQEGLREGVESKSDENTMYVERKSIF